MTDELKTPARAYRRWGCTLGFVLALLLLAWLAWTGWQTYTRVQRLQSNLGALQALADPGTLMALQPQDLVGLRDQVQALDDDVQALARTARPLLFVAPALGWLPKAGPEAAQAAPLLDMASATSAAARLALDALAPALAAWQDETSDQGLLPRLVPALTTAAPQFAEVALKLDAAAAARARLEPAQLSQRSQSLIEQFDKALPLLQTVAKGVQVAPALLGAEGPRSYLLLAQNNDELRGTGGFISGVGLLRFDQGRMDATLQDSYAVDDWSNPHPDAPEPLLTHMKAEVLALRDANWWPDFPTSARAAQALYAQDQKVTTDGVVAFDLDFVRALVAALGPLQLTGYQEPVTGDNIVTAMRTVWAQPVDAAGTVEQAQTSDWWGHRKDFMGDLMQGALAKVQSGAVAPGPLAWVIKEALEKRQLQVSVNDPAVETLLANNRWNGAVDPGPGDFWLVVDSNVGWNKVNPRITQRISYTVTLAEDGPPRAEMVIAYQHASEPSDQPCVHEARYGDSYEDMMNRCYFNYLRVFVPAGATLRESTGLEPGTETVGPVSGGVQSWEGYFVLPPGATQQVRFVYDLPQTFDQDGRYTLRIQKQAGAQPWPVTVTLNTPPGQEMQPITPGAVVEDGRMMWSLQLDRDQELVVGG
jgi:hypothetical protein